MTGLSAPAWLTAPAEAGLVRGVGEIRIWSPADAAENEPLPLLVVNDGPEYDEQARLTRYLEAGVTGSWLPRLRAVLLAPGERSRQYSASIRYASALARMTFPPATSTIGMGTSLGALAMLHAHCRHPELFDALFLQSGSFFCPRFDDHERGFAYYPRIVRFVTGATFGRPVPVALTCGVLEENISNNRLMAERLRDSGYLATLHEMPDTHNYTAWRDAFDPHLTRLLQRVCQ